MSAFKPTRIVNVEVLQQLDRANFLAFAEPFRGHFERWAMPLPSLNPDDGYDFHALMVFLQNTDNGHPPELLDALHFLNPFCAEDANDELVAELDSLKLIPAGGNAYSAADWAIFAWRAAPEVIVRFFPRFALRPGHSVHSFRARSGTNPSLSLAKLADLEGELRRWFNHKKRGDGTTVRHFVEKDESHTFVVRHGETFARFNVMESEKSASVGHPATFVVVQLNLNPLVLRVVSKSAAVQQFCRVKFGEFLFEDPELFDGPATYTLAPLRQSALHISRDCLVPGLVSVAVTELHYVFGGLNEERMILRGKNLAYRFDDDGIAQERTLPKCAPTFARFALQLQGSDDLVYVDVKPPNGARPSRRCDGAIIAAFLAKAEIMIGVPEDAPEPVPELVGAP